MDRAHRQTHLGPSPNGILAIIDSEPVHHGTDRERSSLERSSSESLPSTGYALMLGLPQELLIAIIELAIFRPCNPQGCPDCKFAPNADCAKALSRVCRRVSRIAQPMLFHTIDFEGAPWTVPPKKGVLLLHRTLKENPSLCQHCRRLSVSVSDVRPGKPEDWAVVNCLSHLLTRVRCLRVHGGFDRFNERTWNLVRNLTQSMGDVRHWKLFREGWGLYLDQALVFSLPKLEKLEIHGIRERKDLPLQLDPKVRTVSGNAYRH